ncbi:MAG: WYL domain-containing protein [Humidesulfovibrio sp.]|nr:WYL domain-containing protein [Humidesulfovibrio sp.]
MGNIVILTGAGISAESGLGTFRDKEGLWAKFNPAELASPRAFAKDPARVHEFYNLRRTACVEAEPNAAHLALAHSADHRARGTAKLSRNTRLGPIAMLFGQGRQYLLAWSEYQDDLRLFALAGFERISLEPDVYERPNGFDLQDWLSQSFGIWREEPQDVVWRFLPEVADEAAGYVFHPKQQTERLADGSLMVRFRAGGRQEMEWYLVRWGDQVEAQFLEVSGTSASDTPENDVARP